MEIVILVNLHDVKNVPIQQQQVVHNVIQVIHCIKENVTVAGFQIANIVCQKQIHWIASNVKQDTQSM